MKKEYNMPVMELIELKMTSILCISGELGANAGEPALVPEMDELSIEMDVLSIDIEEY